MSENNIERQLHFFVYCKNVSKHCHLIPKFLTNTLCLQNEAGKSFRFTENSGPADRVRGRQEVPGEDGWPGIAGNVARKDRRDRISARRRNAGELFNSVG